MGNMFTRSGEARLAALQDIISSTGQNADPVWSRSTQGRLVQTPTAAEASRRVLRATINARTACSQQLPEAVINVSPSASPPGFVMKEKQRADAKGRLPTGQRQFRGIRVESHWRTASRARNSGLLLLHSTFHNNITGR